jgi:outer membrane murein-binding lipoprotein Lpp
MWPMSVWPMSVWLVWVVEKEVVVTVVAVTAEEAMAGCTNKSRADEVPSQACRLQQPTLQIL